MAKTNRFYQPMQGNYISQYADYKLPYEAIQNAVIGRQQRFDQNQAMLANAANKYGQIASRSVDSEGKALAIDRYLEDVNQTVNEKYGGDFSLAADEIYNKTAQFTANPMWDKMRSALENEQRYNQMKDSAILNQHEFYERPGSTGNQSIFGEGGELRDVNYDYLTIDPVKDRAYREQLFNNKELDKNSGLSIKKFNEQALRGEDPFLAYYETESRNFSDPYLESAVDDYINSGMPKYQKYLDKHNGDHNKARAEVLRDIVSVSKEYTVNKTTANLKENRVYDMAVEAAQKEEEDAINLVKIGERAEGILTDENGEAISNFRGIQALANNPNATPTQRRAATEIMRNVREQAFNGTEQADGSIKYDYPVLVQRQQELDAWNSNNRTQMINEVAVSGVKSLFGDDVSEQNLNAMTNILNNALDPDNVSDVGLFSGLWESIKSGGRALMAGMPGIGNPGMVNYHLSEGTKNALEKDKKYATSFNTDDPGKALETLSAFLREYPEVAQELGFDSTPSNTSFASPYSIAGQLEKLIDSPKISDKGEKLINDYSGKVGLFNKERDKVFKTLTPANNAYNEDRLMIQDLDPQGHFFKSFSNSFAQSVGSLITKEDLAEQTGLDIGDGDYQKVLNSLTTGLGDLKNLNVYRDNLNQNIKIEFPSVNVKENVPKDIQITLNQDLQRLLNDALMTTESRGQNKYDFAQSLETSRLKDNQHGIPDLIIKTNKDGNLYLGQGDVNNAKTLTYGDVYNLFLEYSGMAPQELEIILQQNPGLISQDYLVHDGENMDGIIKNYFPIRNQQYE